MNFYQKNFIRNFLKIFILKRKNAKILKKNFLPERKSYRLWKLNALISLAHFPVALSPPFQERVGFNCVADKKFLFLKISTECNFPRNFTQVEFS